MAEDRAAVKRRAGEQLAGSMRRIGHRHAVVLEPVVVRVVDINELHNNLGQCNSLIDQTTRRLAQLRAQRTILEQRIAEFDTAPIDRVDGDPEVPLDAPQPEVAPSKPAEAEPDKPAEAAATGPAGPRPGR